MDLFRRTAAFFWLVLLLPTATPQSASADVQYLYDSAGRLIRATYSNGVVVEYRYDAVGNRQQIFAASSGNQLPVANNDAATVVASGSVVIQVRTNDSDPDGDALTVTAVSGVSGGGTAVISDGGTTVTYAAPEQAGAKSFTYSISDGRGGMASATVVVTVDAGLDYVLDPLDWADANSGQSGNIGAVFTNYQVTSGITHPITLRFSVVYSGNLDAGSFNIFSATRNSFIGTVPLGNGSVDVSVNPGETINLYSDALTSSGIRNGTWAVTVANLFTGASTVDTANLSVTVDSDNDFNVPDYTLDSIPFYSAGNYPNDGTGNATVVNGGSFATGINRQIYMYAVVSPVFRGGTADSYFTVYVGGNSASWNVGDTTAKTFGWYTNPGDFVGASAALSQFNDGDAYAYWHVDIYNGSTGDHVGSYDGGLTTSR